MTFFNPPKGGLELANGNLASLACLEGIHEKVYFSPAMNNWPRKPYSIKEGSRLTNSEGMHKSAFIRFDGISPSGAGPTL